MRELIRKNLSKVYSVDAPKPVKIFPDLACVDRVAVALFRERTPFL
jgi:hypothetical protein